MKDRQKYVFDTNSRLNLLNELVDEVTKDNFDVIKVKELAQVLNIEYSEDPMQFLNNVLKGIHSPGVKHEPHVE
jgi:hypothetical protein